MEKNKANKVVYINSCNFCGRNIKDEWIFCPFCKTRTENFICIFCGGEIKTNWNYCPHCKKEVKTEHKNRQRVDKCNEWLRDILKNS